MNEKHGITPKEGSNLKLGHLVLTFMLIVIVSLIKGLPGILHVITEIITFLRK